MKTMHGLDGKNIREKEREKLLCSRVIYIFQFQVRGGKRMEKSICHSKDNFSDSSAYLYSACRIVIEVHSLPLKVQLNTKKLSTKK